MKLELNFMENMMAVKLIVKASLTVIFRNAIKQSLLNNTNMDFTDPKNLDNLADDILNIISNDMENILRLLSYGFKQ